MNEVHTLTRREIAEDLRMKVNKNRKSDVIRLAIFLPLTVAYTFFMIMYFSLTDEELTFSSVLYYFGVIIPFTLMIIYSFREIKDVDNKLKRISEDGFAVRKVVLTDKYVAVKGGGRNSRSAYEFSFNDGMYKIEVTPLRYNSIHSVGDSFYIVLWSPSSTSILEFYNCKGVEYKERLD